MSGIARLGDKDNLGHSIAGGCDSGVLINGIPVAHKGSTMDDGVPIVAGTIDGVTVNGIPVAVIGSVTSPHTRNPGRFSPGTIVGGDGGVSAS